MPRRVSRSQKRPVSDINVVPYIDVMLVLLVIFMVTAPLLTQGISVQLPSVQSKSLPTQSDLPIVLSIASDGRYYLNVSARPKQPIDSLSVSTRVRALLSMAKQAKHVLPPVYVKADTQVSYGVVAHAMGLLQQAGATTVGLLTKGPSA